MSLRELVRNKFEVESRRIILVAECDYSGTLRHKADAYNNLREVLGDAPIPHALICYPPETFSSSTGAVELAKYLASRTNIAQAYFKEGTTWGFWWQAPRRLRLGHLSRNQRSLQLMAQQLEQAGGDPLIIVMWSMDSIASWFYSARRPKGLPFDDVFPIAEIFDSTVMSFRLSRTAWGTHRLKLEQLVMTRDRFPQHMLPPELQTKEGSE